MCQIEYEPNIDYQCFCAKLIAKAFYILFDFISLELI